MADVKLTAVIEAEDRASSTLKKFNDGLKAVKEESKKTEEAMKSIKTATAIAGAAFVSITAAIGLSVKQYASAGSELHDMSQRTGVSTEALSKLKYAAELSGSSIGAIEVAIKKMSLQMLSISTDGQEASKGLSAINISVNDLIGLNPEEKFMKVALAVANIEDPTKKAAVAMQVFGKSGTDLLPMLADGEAGIKTMFAEAEKLGIVFSDTAANAADEFGDSLQRLSDGMSGVRNSIAKVFLPILQSVVDKMQPAIEKISDWIEKNPDLVKAITAATLALLGIATALGTATIAVMSFNVAVAKLGLTMSVIPWAGLIIALTAIATIVSSKLNQPWNDFTATMDAHRERLNSLTDKYRDLKKPIMEDADQMKQFTDQMKASAKAIGDIQKSISDAIKESGERQKQIEQDIGTAVVDQRKKIAELQKEIARSTDDDEIRSLKEKLVVEQTALQNHSDLQTQYATQIAEATRFQALTEFEQKLEMYAQQKAQEDKQLKEKLASLSTELKAEQAKFATLKNEQAEYTTAIVNANKERIENAKKARAEMEAEAKAMAADMAALAEVTGGSMGSSFGSTLAKWAKKIGSFVFSSSIGINDGIVQNGQVISTNPQDTIIAMKEPGKLNESGEKNININISGAILTEDAARVMGDMIISQLRFQLKF